MSSILVVTKVEPPETQDEFNFNTVENVVDNFPPPDYDNKATIQNDGNDESQNSGQKSPKNDALTPVPSTTSATTGQQEEAEPDPASEAPQIAHCTVEPSETSIGSPSAVFVKDRNLLIYGASEKGKSFG